MRLTVPGWLRRPVVRVRRRHRVRGARTIRRPRVRLLTGVVCLLAGLMIVASGLSARGTDLRPNRHTDLVGILNAEKQRNLQLAEQLTELRTEVDRLTEAAQPAGGDPQAAERRTLAGLRAMQGPALTVTLSDAPADIQPPGVDDDDLIVHQQDIQSVVNAMWQGGAEAVTIQGQRVISTTGIKCVGNSVVLHGVPYAPPYVITAIGDRRGMEAALDSSDYITIYKQYVEAYGLGFEQEREDDTTLPGYRGALELRYARPLTTPPG